MKQNSLSVLLLFHAHKLCLKVNCIRSLKVQFKLEPMKDNIQKKYSYTKSFFGSFFLFFSTLLYCLL